MSRSSASPSTPRTPSGRKVRKDKGIRRKPIIVLPDGLESRPRLTGLKLIAAYLDLRVLEVERIIMGTAKSDDPFPVWKFCPGLAANARWHIYIDDLDAWMDRRSMRRGGWGEVK